MIYYVVQMSNLFIPIVCKGLLISDTGNRERITLKKYIRYIFMALVYKTEQYFYLLVIYSHNMESTYIWWQLYRQYVFVPFEEKLTGTVLFIMGSLEIVHTGYIRTYISNHNKFILSKEIPQYWYCTGTVLFYFSKKFL